MTSDAVVSVVDDDAAVRDSIAMLLSAEGFTVACYEHAAAFLDACDGSMPGCLVTDMRMPGMDGLELQQQLVTRGVGMPVIVITGHGDVPAAVRALKAGAVDFIQKPFEPETLLACVREALDRDVARCRRAARVSAQAQRLACLTGRERQVMEQVVAGHANKVIAIELGISERTVELHRSRVMKKLGVRSVAELTRVALGNGDTSATDGRSA